jgi:alkaline phosphatase D
MTKRLSRQRLSRRNLIALAGGAALTGLAGMTGSRGASAAAATKGMKVPVRLSGGLFTLGVASGDPTPDGAVLWTRLAPDPLAGGGMPNHDVLVRWEVAEDPYFRRSASSGTATAHSAWGHSVHVELSGLRPDRYYWYRFRAPGRTEISPIGRLRTAPAAAANARLRWAVTCCQSWQDGLYTAWQDVAEQDLAFVVFLGDYIYESAPKASGYVRPDVTAEPHTLEQYRNRYAQYHLDTNLQAAHAAHPFVVILDDHEVVNNWAGDVVPDPEPQSVESFRRRRIAAFRAYWEHLPLPFSARPRGEDAQFYRRLSFGRLATLSMLDTRQYRSGQPATIVEANDPSRTMTGRRQEKWLLEGLIGSRAGWNLVGNQTMMAQSDRVAGPGQAFDFDNWDGYRAQRRRLLSIAAAAKVRNLVVLTGDRHATWVSDLKPDFDDPAAPVVGAELTGTSITSAGNPDVAAFHRSFDPIKAESPHWQFIDNQRGYLLCDADRERLSTELRAVTTVTEPGGSVSSYARFVTENGVPGVTVDDVAMRPVAQIPRLEMGPAGVLPLDDGTQY